MSSLSLKHILAKKNINYICRSKEEAIDRFFLLWTRKEALLKALGTGIINNLKRVNVSEASKFYKKGII